MQVQQTDILNLPIFLPNGLGPQSQETTADPTIVPGKLPFDLLLSNLLPQDDESTAADVLATLKGEFNSAVQNQISNDEDSPELQAVVGSQNLELPTTTVLDVIDGPQTIKSESGPVQTNSNLVPSTTVLLDSAPKNLLPLQLRVTNAVPAPLLATTLVTPIEDQVKPIELNLSQKTGTIVQQQPEQLQVATPPSTVLEGKNTQALSAMFTKHSVGVDEARPVRAHILAERIPTEFTQNKIQATDAHLFEKAVAQAKVTEIKITAPERQSFPFVPTHAKEQIDSQSNSHTQGKINVHAAVREQSAAIEHASTKQDQQFAEEQRIHSLEKGSAASRTESHATRTEHIHPERLHQTENTIDSTKQAAGSPKSDTTTTMTTDKIVNEKIQINQPIEKTLQSSIIEPAPSKASSSISEQPTAPARITLPEHAVQTLKPNGQSVQLRIEPEHLGPARLSLTMTDDKLQARVIVTDVVSKAVVESSLKNLVDQLGKHAIRVDRIEVSVSGQQMSDSGHSHLFHQRAQAPVGRQAHFVSYEQEPGATTDQLRSVAPTYINNHGVNILA